MRAAPHIVAFIALGLRAHAQQPGWHWARLLTGAWNDRFTDVETDALGNVYVAGSLSSDTVWLGDVPVVRPMGAPSASFVAMYNYLGTAQWAIPVVGNAVELWRSPTGAVLAGSIFTGDHGPLSGIVSSPTSWSYVMWDISNTGTMTIALQLADLIAPAPNNSAPTVLADTIAGITLTGSFQDSVMIADTTIHAFPSGRYVARFAVDGTFRWARVFIHHDDTMSSGSTVTDSKVEASGTVHLSGVLHWFGTVCDSMPGFISPDAGWYAAFADDGSVNRVLFPEVDVVYGVGAFDVRANGNLVWAHHRGGNNDWHTVVEELDTQGDLVWSVEESGISLSTIERVRLLSDGSALAWGSFAGFTLNDCTPTAFVGTPGIVARRIDPLGACEWQLVEDVSGLNTWAAGTAMQDDHTHYVIGLLDGTGSLGPDALSSWAPSSPSFLAKLSTTDLATAQSQPTAKAVFPNPTTGPVQVPSCLAALLVRDASGRQLFSLNCSTGPLDLSALAPGLYFLSWNGQTQRLVKE